MGMITQGFLQPWLRRRNRGMSWVRLCNVSSGSESLVLKCTGRVANVTAATNARYPFAVRLLSPHVSSLCLIRI